MNCVKTLVGLATAVALVLGTGSVNAFQSASGVASNADVIKLTKAGLGEPLIIQSIEQATEPTFDLSPDALVDLKTAGVSDAVISAMMAHKSAVAKAERARPPAIDTKHASSTSRPPRELKGGILDEVKLYVERPSATRVVVRPFSAADSDIVRGEKKDETKTLQADGPRLLADRLVARLKEAATFTEVSLSQGPTPDDALLVEGKFVELDPGSRAKRYFAGFGAGKSAVTVIGTVRSSDGTLLATFEQRRVGVMGAFGGDSIGKMTSDAKSIGEDIALFLTSWTTGKNLK